MVSEQTKLYSKSVYTEPLQRRYGRDHLDVCLPLALATSQISTRQFPNPSRETPAFTTDPVVSNGATADPRVVRTLAVADDKLAVLRPSTTGSSSSLS